MPQGSYMRLESSGNLMYDFCRWLVVAKKEYQGKSLLLIQSLFTTKTPAALPCGNMRKRDFLLPQSEFEILEQQDQQRCSVQSHFYIDMSNLSKLWVNSYPNRAISLVRQLV